MPFAWTAIHLIDIINGVSHSDPGSNTATSTEKDAGASLGSQRKVRRNISIITSIAKYDTQLSGILKHAVYDKYTDIRYVSDKYSGIRYIQASIKPRPREQFLFAKFIFFFGHTRINGHARSFL